MIGTATALIVNYPGGKLHKSIINSHAGPALMMCSTLMGAGVLMGVLVKDVKGVTSVITCMSNLITQFMPDVLGRHLPLVIGVLSVPLALAFDTDSYFYGMLPVVIGIGKGFGIDALPIAVAMVVCRNCATFISPMVPATLLGVGPHQALVPLGVGLQLHLHDRRRGSRHHACVIWSIIGKSESGGVFIVCRRFLIVS